MMVTSFVLLLCFASFAQSEQMPRAVIPSSTDKQQMIGISAGLYDTENSYIEQDYYSELGEGELIVPQTKVEVLGPGYSANADALWLSNGTYYNISLIANWQSGDVNVLFADQGTIFGENTGSTQVTVSFNGKSVTFEASVAGLAGDTQSRNAANYTNAQRVILDKAVNAINNVWTPVKDVTGWRNRYRYFGGTQYKGIIYSQNYQRSPDTYAWDVANRSDFYDSFSSGSVVMPKYGMDCSAFVSYVWNIRRDATSGFIRKIKEGKYARVGNYDPNNPTPESLMASYRNLKSGDAIVKQGHIRLVESVEGNTIHCYEQSPEGTVIRSYSFEILANAQDPNFRYLPFSLQDTPDKASLGTWTSTGPRHQVQDTNATAISGGSSSSSNQGWKKEGNDWVYLQNGQKVYGWQRISGLWYYFSSKGVMRTGWINPTGEYYYLNSDGVMITSAWVSYGSDWYYIRSNGMMAKSRWQKSGPSWYYLQNDGKMAKSTSLRIDNKRYNFNSNGVCTNP